MKNLLQSILPFDSPRHFVDENTRKRFIEWDKPSRQIQISAVTALTAVLYLIFTFLEKSWAPANVQLLMLQLHIFIIVPLLLTISLLAYKKRFYNYVMFLISIYPIISISCHAYITTKLTNFGPFLIEGYLGVFWVFVISGITFRYALIAAVISSIILIVSSYFLMADPDIYAIHVFWIFCSFSFGFLAALIFDRSRKAVFISQQKLHQLALTDPLTGIFNRNQLNITINQEIGRALRYEKPFGFLMFDVDHFKKINDNFGHDQGDKVLQHIANLLKDSLRENDTLIRWGGEEFVIIAVEVEEQSLAVLCEKLRQKIASANFGPAGKVTISIGATMYQIHDTQDELLSRADKALYQAKNEGRNTAIIL
ncbi:GGDEF domain-containing protein [Colwellia sp. 1_MG-2023]|uniref:GGDEF domain-containing protein n=1 Tax=Colwellia sp. 1_MG-2023 TaxID=3062649 RepID=UPI0026E48839|nr:GGDEF domain-containing protein [Colwellia sp. 1_MG-2023]MDO6446258.1 GGDEF domain-containing protein [Colwellia sp. 1_MG-2023]